MRINNLQLSLFFLAFICASTSCNNNKETKQDATRDTSKSKLTTETLPNDDSSYVLFKNLKEDQIPPCVSLSGENLVLNPGYTSRIGGQGQVIVKPDSGNSIVPMMKMANDQQWVFMCNCNRGNGSCSARTSGDNLVICTGEDCTGHCEMRISKNSLVTSSFSASSISNEQPEMPEGVIKVSDHEIKAKAGYAFMMLKDGSAVIGKKGTGSTLKPVDNPGVFKCKCKEGSGSCSPERTTDSFSCKGDCADCSITIVKLSLGLGVSPSAIRQ